MLRPVTAIAERDEIVESVRAALRQGNAMMGGQAHAGGAALAAPVAVPLIAHLPELVPIRRVLGELPGHRIRNTEKTI